MEFENSNDNKKKKITFMIIGLVILLILVIGSTYAYFSVDVNNSSTETSVTAKTEKIGNATLTTTQSELYLRVSGEDMSEANIGNTYWATPSEEDGRIVSDDVQSHKIAEVKIDGGEDDTNYLCSADVVVTAEGDMMQTVHGEENEGNELVFNLSSSILNDTTDFYWDELSSKTIKWNFKIQGNNIAELYTYLKLYNSEYEQAYLAGKNLEINIETKNLKCEVYEPFTGGTGLELAKSSQPGLNNELVGDMYRFQGTLADNYLCFGQTCKNESDEMYRIIGVTEDGKIKVIKQKSIGDMKWHHCDEEGDNVDDEYACGAGIQPPEWPNSDVYNYLNTNEQGFYQTLDVNIKNKIQEYDWKYGDIQDEGGDINTYGNANTTGIEVYNIENSFEETIQANIGLMYLSDYYLATSNDAKCHYYSDTYGSCAASWIHQTQNGVSEADEWTMSRYGLNSSDYYTAWSVYCDGDVFNDVLYSTYAVRPVFYLNAETIITRGTGTAEDPFVIE